jgi:DNA polymerase III epsilon subunit-like protein
MFIFFLILSVVLIIFYTLPSGFNLFEKIIIYKKANIIFEKINLKIEDIDSKINFSESISKIPYYFFFDVETTGLIKKKGSHPFYDNLNFPRIVSISWLVFDFNQNLISLNNYIIYQNEKIPKKSIEIHKISDKKASDFGVLLYDVMDLFRKDLEKCKLMVAHNLNFDFDTIQADCYRNKIEAPTPINLYCTMLEGTNFCQIYPNSKGNYKYPKLEELFHSCFYPEYKYMNNFVGGHNALFDTKLTAACYFKMNEILNAQLNV